MPMVAIVTEGRRRGVVLSTSSGSAGPKGPLPEELPSLQLVQPTPDAVALADLEGVFQALLADGAPGTQGLCLGLPPVFLNALLEVVGGEEQRGILAATGGVELPAPHPVDSHSVGRDGPSLLRGPLTYSLRIWTLGGFPPFDPGSRRHGKRTIRPASAWEESGPSEALAEVRQRPRVGSRPLRSRVRPEGPDRPPPGPEPGSPEGSGRRYSALATGCP
jgi:hypothetical protein